MAQLNATRASSSRRSLPSLLNRALERRLLSYAAAATATGVSALALVQSSSAEIVYTPTQQKIAHGGTVAIDLNHDGITDFIITSNTSTCGFANHGCLRQKLSVSPSQENQIMANDLYALALSGKQKIGSAGNFSGERPFMDFCTATLPSHSNTPGGSWLNQKNGAYLGLKFYINGQIHFGWARLKVVVNEYTCNAHAILTGYAYETIPNRPILAGQASGAENSSQQAPSSGRLGSLAAGRVEIEALPQKDEK
jgi:hypothetical protein